MREISLVMAVVASMLIFTACCNDEEVTRGAEEEVAQSIVVQVVNSGDKMITRAGRPLYSSEAAHDIDHVKLVIYNPLTKVIAFDEYLDHWKTISKEYSSVSNGTQYTLVLKGEDKLAAGNYKMLAIGHATGTDYVYSPLLTDLTKDEDYTVDNIIASIAAEAEEVFAGEVDLIVPSDNDQAFATPVTIHRQVAGGFGYFKNIPAVIDGIKSATLRLIAIGKNEAVEFKHFHSGFTDIPATGALHIVNGTNPATATSNVFFSDNATNGHIIYSIDLAASFPNGDTNEDGFLGVGDTGWVNPTDLNIIEGSVFAGKFIIPFNYSTGKNTMELQLLAQDGNILKHWTVKIPNADLATGKEAPQVNDESVYAYNVVRNHMYNIGTKTTNAGTGTEVPGEEETEDLSKDQDIILKINDNWELIHSMELE